MGRRRNPPAPPQMQAPVFSPIELQKLGELTKLDLNELGSYMNAFPDFLKQESVLGDLQGFSSKANQTLKDSLESSAPGLNEGVQTLSRTALSQLQGDIPQDVQDEIFRSAAFRELSSGLGGESRRARNLTARDLGLTSLELQQQGIANMGTAMQGAAALNPVQAADLLFSPGDVLARQDANVAIRNEETAYNTSNENFRTIYNNDVENQQRYYNTNVKNQQATANTNIANANASNRYNYDMMRFQQSQQGGLAGLGGMLGTIAGGALGSFMGPGGMIAGAGIGQALGGGIQSAATGGGFMPMASGLMGAVGMAADIGVTGNYPYGMVSRAFERFGYREGGGGGGYTPLPRSSFLNQGAADPRLGFAPQGRGGRMSVTAAGARAFGQ